MKIVALVGSLKQDSITAKAVQVAAAASRREGVEVVFWDLKEKPLHIYDPSDAENYSKGHVPEFVALFDQADGFLLGSPEYHNSVSGVFKNALDFVGYNQFSGKPVGLIASGGGPVATNTLNTMMTIIRSLHGYLSPHFGAVPGGTQFNPDGTFSDEKLQERFEAIGKDVARLVKLFAAAK
ncbi:NAD(P)H-dependent oxidoreductase [Tumebacillus sp. DT12]|uniref:NAD(P)H-dependent oxidoreductase n=1 Tax=Tumebacillus lacus TaxID=2995335 RepID=A0ABT3WWH4_9BACL|nr:NADPH-dependent FMN reductase [Tumebacillus lacus]MCX7569028.1 NAD(P)H-dependent oxidoreductase [Tumebacillus lacus]